MALMCYHEATEGTQIFSHLRFYSIKKIWLFFKTPVFTTVVYV